MKKYYFLTLFATLAAWAQPQWEALGNIPVNANNQRFDDVFFLNENLGWAANGAYAAIYKTTDGGVNWTLQLAEQTPELPGNYYFRNVEFLNENVGFLGTLTANKFFRTLDGGQTWSLVTNFSTAPGAVCGIDCVGNSTVYGCGSYLSDGAYLIKSTDSGATWQYIDMSAYAQCLVEVLFLDENTGYASGRTTAGGTILKTVDGGVTWTELYNTGLAGEYVWKLQVLGSDSNVIFGAVESVSPFLGKLVRSTDNGINWTSHEVPDTDIQAVGFLTPEHGFMGGHSSPILETTDGGATWTENLVGSNLNRIQFLGNNLAYASGSTIYKFTDNTLGNPSFKESARKPLDAFIAPNPVKEKLNVTIDFKDIDNVVLELYDINGKRLQELKRDLIAKPAKKNYTFDFPYSSGAYFLNIHNDTGRQSIKFVK